MAEIKENSTMYAKTCLVWKDLADVIIVKSLKKIKD